MYFGEQIAYYDYLCMDEGLRSVVFVQVESHVCKR